MTPFDERSRSRSRQAVGAKSGSVSRQKRLFVIGIAAGAGWYGPLITVFYKLVSLMRTAIDLGPPAVSATRLASVSGFLVVSTQNGDPRPGRMPSSLLAFLARSNSSALVMLCDWAWPA
jgi:hypothetical protein